MRVGIVGTGFAARLRASALQDDGRADLVGVSGHRTAQLQDFVSEFGGEGYPDWSALLHEAALDLVFVSTINRDHASITQAALGLGIHVVVEYPLAFDLEEAQSLVAFAKQRHLLLHVEHIELLSGIHLLLEREIRGIGDIFTVRYITLSTNRPAPERWTYVPDLFGFPLVGAVSRIHRLINLFGPIKQVSCQNRYDGLALPHRFSSCYCSALLTFTNGLTATLIYGKGESVWRSQRTIEVHGHRGAVLIDGEQAVLIRPDGAHPLDVGSRRGLFEQDTRMVLDHLFHDKRLYVNAGHMLHALETAIACERSAARDTVVTLPLDLSVTPASLQ